MFNVLKKGRQNIQVHYLSESLDTTSIQANVVLSNIDFYLLLKILKYLKILLKCF